MLTVLISLLKVVFLLHGGRWLSWLEHTLDKGGVESSSLSRPTNFRSGGLAQLGERLICIQEVSGSIPLSSTRKHLVIKNVNKNNLYQYLYPNINFVIS